MASVNIILEISDILSKRKLCHLLLSALINLLFGTSIPGMIFFFNGSFFWSGLLIKRFFSTSPGVRFNFSRSSTNPNERSCGATKYKMIGRKRIKWIGELEEPLNCLTSFYWKNCAACLSDLNARLISFQSEYTFDFYMNN